MIFYFSATGNDLYVARRIAEATGDDTASIGECVQLDKSRFKLAQGEPIGFVIPTYFWGLPSIVESFLSGLELDMSGERYAYQVMTCGTVTGSAHTRLQKLLKAIGVNVQGRYTVKMVDTWTPLYDVSDAEANRRVSEAAEPQITRVIERISQRAVGAFDLCKGPAFLSPMLRKEYEKKRSTSFFHVEDSCVGCGLCARVCPLSAIRLGNGKPVWVKGKCTMCLGCLHRCPKFAIQYGESTAKHGQFVNPNVTL